MSISEETLKQVALLIIVVGGILIFIFLLDNVLTGGKFARAIACGILFWIPYGALAIAFTHGCAAIPV